jgi:hypothetical protein
VSSASRRSQPFRQMPCKYGSLCSLGSACQYLHTNLAGDGNYGKPDLQKTVSSSDRVNNRWKRSSEIPSEASSFNSSSKSSSVMSPFKGASPYSTLKANSPSSTPTKIKRCDHCKNITHYTDQCLDNILVMRHIHGEYDSNNVDISELSAEGRFILSVITFGDTEYYIVQRDHRGSDGEILVSASKVYAIVPILLQLSDDDAELIVSRGHLIEASFFAGNSSRAGTYSVGIMAKALLREQQFAQMVEANGIKLENIRLSKGFVDSHDMDTSAVVVVGSQVDLTALCVEYNSVRPDFPVISASDGDKASALVYLSFETLDLMKSLSQTEAVRIFEKCCRDSEHIEQFSIPDKDWTVSATLRFLINSAAILERRRELGEGVIVGISHYADGLVGKPLGGKRTVGETPVQCAMREAHEEGGLVIDGNALYRPVWHEQTMINFYYYFYALDRTLA